jgi:hypothetical protein
MGQEQRTTLPEVANCLLPWGHFATTPHKSFINTWKSRQIKGQGIK